MMQQEAYDAILLDPKMPNGGLDLLKKIEARNPNLLKKVIIVTGANHEIDELAGLPLHAIVRKPFELTSFVETVRSCVDSDA